MEKLVESWRAGVVPLRESAGFTVVGAWTIEETNEFVWILGYDGDDGFAAADTAYYASPERSAMTNDPRQYIDAVSVHMAERLL